MTQPIDLDQDQYLQTRPRSFAEEFDDVTEPAFLEQPAAPGPRSSAVIHSNKRKAGVAETNRLRDLEVIDQAAQDEADDLALAKATRLRREGKPVPAGVAARAARAARARGTSRSSAETMAEIFNRGRRS